LGAYALVIAVWRALPTLRVGHRGSTLRPARWVIVADTRRTTPRVRLAVKASDARPGWS